MAICPKCPGKLETINIETIDVEYCSSCEGLWFDKNELDQIIKKDKFHINTPDLNDEDFDGLEITGALKELLDSRPAQCPKCSDHPEMVRKKLNKAKKTLFIDKCPVCEGIWLDGGEINILRNHFFRTISDKSTIARQMVKLFFK